MSSLSSRISRVVPALAGRSGARGGWMRGLRGQRAFARRALGVFVWAILVAPAIHLVDHRNDHWHGPGGVHHRDGAGSTDGVHRHGDGEWHRHHDEAPARGHHLPVTERFAAPGADQEPGGDQAPPAPHGRGDGLHFGLALIDAAPPPVANAPEAHHAALSAQPQSATLAGDRRAPGLPRGPPGVRDNRSHASLRV